MFKSVILVLQISLGEIINIYLLVVVLLVMWLQKFYKIKVMILKLMSIV